jgi:hypothetical protein
VGTTIGTFVGVRGASDAFSRHDAVDAHRQSNAERAFDGVFGVLQLTGAGATGAGVLRSAAQPVTQVVRGPIAATAPFKNFVPVTHLEAAAAEFDLIRTVQRQGEVILKANRTVTQNGADLVTYNPQTGQLTLWDSKTTIGRLNASGGRSPQTVRPSTTLTKRSTLDNALREAREAIQSSNLSSADQARALQAIRDQTYRKVTAGAGNARNSNIQYGP